MAAVEQVGEDAQQEILVRGEEYKERTFGFVFNAFSWFWPQKAFTAFLFSLDIPPRNSFRNNGSSSTCFNLCDS